MKIWLIIFSFAFVIKSLSSEQKFINMLSTIEQLNKQETDACQKVDEVEGVPEDPAQLCATALCGPPDASHFFLQLDDDSFEPHLEPHIQEEISDTIQSMARLAHQTDQAGTQNCSEKILQQLEQIESLSDQQLSQVMDTFLSQYISLSYKPDEPDQFQQHMEEARNNKVDFNPTLTKGNLLMEPKFPEGISNSFKNIINNYAQVKTKKIQDHLNNSWFFFFNHNLDIDDTESLNNIPIPPYLFISPLENELTRVRDPGGSRKRENQILTNKNICPTQNLCHAAIREGLEYMVQKYLQDRQEQQVAAAAFTEESIAFCQSLLTLHTHVHNKAANFRKTFPEIKQAFLDRVFSDYSQQSKQFFNDVLNSLLTIHTPASSNPITEFKKEFKNQITSFENQITSFENQGKENMGESMFSENQVFPLLGHIYNLMNINSICYPQLLKNLCGGQEIQQNIQKHGFPIRNIEDDARLYSISMSPFSCIYHNSYGEQILAHELGHILSHAFTNQQVSQQSSTKYAHLRECASRQYKDTTPIPSDMEDVIDMPYKKDRLKTEEDTADLMAYKVFSENPQLYSCSILHPDDPQNPQSYANLKQTTNQEGHFAPHTDPVARIIREALYKKKEIPPACQQVMEQYQDKLGFELCF